MNITIDAEFKAQIPPLSHEERAQLEKNILEHGCRDPLVVWVPQAPKPGEHKCYAHDESKCELRPGDGVWTCKWCDHNPAVMENILLDGHNRFEICTQHGIEFDVVEVELDDREAASDWIDANQLGRRNLAPDDFRLLLGRRYNRAKKRPGGNGSNQHEQTRQFDGIALGTSESLAAQHHVSPRTVERAGKLVEEVEAQPELMAAVTARDIGLKLAASVAALPEEAVLAVVSAQPEQMREVAREVVKAHVANNSGNNEWYTPAPFIEAARQAMGSIDTDPASSEIANRTVQAEQFFTAEDDGLKQKWRGNVWMNPPYAQPLIANFADALAEKFTAGEVESACVLVNNGTETTWFQRLLEVASAACLIKSRVKFIDPAGKASGAPLQGQAVIYLGREPETFAEAFSTFGKVLYA